MNLSSLLNLPSREGGFLSRVVESEQTSFGADTPASPGAAPADLPNSPTGRHHLPASAELRAYVCDHNTAPPAHQYITTDKTNILIRTLTQRRGKDTLAGNGAASQQQKLGAATTSAQGTNAPARPRLPAFGGTGAETSGSEGGRAEHKRGADAGGGASGGGTRGGLGRQGPSGLGRASKRPALDATAEYRRLETLTADQLREYLRSKGQTGGLDNAGRAALLSRAKLAVVARGGR
jgi:hypothetical protein